MHINKKVSMTSPIWAERNTMGKNKQQEGLSTESLVKILEDTNQARARFYSLITKCSVSIHKKKEDEKGLIALQADSRYIREFCKRVIQNDSIEARSIKTVYDMGEWVKKIKLIWYEKRPPENEIFKLLTYGVFMVPVEKDKNNIVIQRNRRWNQVIIHIF